MSTDRMDLIGLLAGRLERLSVDSIWARRASGTRGSLLKALEGAEQGRRLPVHELDFLIERSFDLLKNAAMEIPDRDHGGGNRAIELRAPPVKAPVRKTHAPRP